MAQTKSFTAFLLVSVGTTMNAVRVTQKGASPFPVILAGLLFGTVCVGLNDISQKSIGTMLAGVFLLSSTLVSGVPLIDSVADLAESYQ